MKNRAEEYLKADKDKVTYRDRYLHPKYPSADEHVRVIARRLIAALFYYEGYSVTADGFTVGTTYCRLSSNAQDSFARLVRADPQFRLCYHDPAKGRPTDLLPVFWDVETFSSPVSFRVIAERLTIKMKKLPKWPEWEPISGFAYLWSIR